MFSTTRSIQKRKIRPIRSRIKKYHFNGNDTIKCFSKSDLVPDSEEPSGVEKRTVTFRASTRNPHLEFENFPTKPNFFFKIRSLLRQSSRFRSVRYWSDSGTRLRKMKQDEMAPNGP